MGLASGSCRHLCQLAPARPGRTRTYPGHIDQGAAPAQLPRRCGAGSGRRPTGALGLVGPV